LLGMLLVNGIILPFQCSLFIVGEAGDPREYDR